MSDSFAQSQASYAARELNEAWQRDKREFSIEDYLQRLNSAFFGLASFSIVNDVVTFTNEIKGVVVYGKKRK